MRGGRRTGSLLLPVLFCVLCPSLAHARQWAVDLSAGRALYEGLNDRVGAVNLAAGFRYESDRQRWGYLSGGLDLEKNGPRWAAGGAGGWMGVERGALALGVSLGAHGFGYSLDVTEEFPTDNPAGTPELYLVEKLAWGATLEALPALRLRRGTMALEAHAGVVQTVRTMAGQFHLGDYLLARTAFDGGGSAAVEAGHGLRLGAEGRFLYLPSGGHPYAGASAQYARGAGSLWASAGRWMSPGLAGDSALGYGVGGSLRTGAGWELLAAWQQDASDPLYENTPRSSWSVRLSRALGRRPPAPLPALVPPEAADGRVAIRLPVAGHPAAPLVLGDFTGWEPVPMVRVGEFWELRVEIPSGVHRYGFRSAQGEWFVPESFPQADDGMGGTSAVLVVP